MEITGVKPGTIEISATINYSLIIVTPVNLFSLTCDSDVYTSDGTLVTSDKI